MTLHAGTGTGPVWAGSLGQSIEAAFAGELFALRGDKLPETAIEDRRMLFAAIARGVLQHLAENPTYLDVPLPWYMSDPLTLEKKGHANVHVLSPVLKLSGGIVSGTGWSTQVTLTLLRAGDQQPGDEQHLAPDGNGELSYSGFVGMKSGDVIDARDGSGRAAQAVVA